MTLRKRTTRAGTAMGAVALAAAGLLAVTGCAPSAAKTAASGTRHSLTIAEAQQVYARYIAESRQYATDGEKIKALNIVAGAAWAQAKGQYEAQASTGTAIPSYSYGSDPKFYVPALSGSGYPQWFVVEVPRAAETDGRAGTAVETLMVFDHLTPADLWTLNGAATLDGPLPSLAMHDGYAVDVADNDEDLLLRPDVVGASQAAVVDEGPANPSAAVISRGTLTTGLYTAQNTHASSEATQGLTYTWLLEGAAFPLFSLQTTNGGALVLYSMYLNTTTAHRNLVAGAPITVPAGFSPLFAAPTEVGYHAVYANSTYQYAAVDPPSTQANAKVGIVASGGGPTYGHAY